MILIGLTGPSGAGKSTVAKLFESENIPVVDADCVYHSLLIPPSPCLEELTACFGREILSADGTLNRPALASIVFSDPQKLKKLNSIAHRHVLEQAFRKLDGYRTRGIPAAVFDAPQLFESGANRRCDTVVSVLADPSQRLCRIMERDGLEKSAVLSRMDAQLSDDYFRDHSDFIIENSGDEKQLVREVQKILVSLGVKNL